MPTRLAVLGSLLILWAGVAGSVYLYTFTRGSSRIAAEDTLNRFCNRKKTETYQQFLGGVTILVALNQAAVRYNMALDLPNPVWFNTASQLVTKANWKITALSNFWLFPDKSDSHAWAAAHNVTIQPPVSAEMGIIDPDRPDAFVILNSYPNRKLIGIDYYQGEAPAAVVRAGDMRRDLTVSQPFFDPFRTNRHFLFFIPRYNESGAFFGGVSGLYRDEVMIVDKSATPDVSFSLTLNNSSLVLDPEFESSDIVIAFPFTIANGEFTFACGRKYSAPLTPFVILVMGIILSLLIPTMSIIYMRQLRLVQTQNTARMAAESQAAAAKIGETAAKEAAQIKSAFFCTMSHEIRTPLNGIKGNAEFLLETRLTEEQASFATTISESTSLLMTIVNDVLDFEKIESAKMTKEELPTDLTVILQHLSAAFATKIRENDIEFITVVPPDLCIITDPSRLRQILNNLVSNALKFTHHGKVIVRASVVLNACDSPDLGSRVVFEVEDTGIGMSSKQDLFAPFTQADSSTSRKYGGTGLGLSISKRLVTLLGGEIGVESSLGEGSRFKFWIPYVPYVRIKETLPEPSHVSIVIPEAATEQKILIVDDNSVNRKVAERTLAKLGYPSASVEDGEKAVQAINGCGGFSVGEFSAVLMDISMPVMDGYASARAIRQLGHRIPIIATTANVLDMERQRCLDAGMDEYLTKPIDRMRLKELLTKCLAQSETHDPKG
ncbi:hypothetical protein DFJ77DRAFT_509599 [Powellomyces hirtus]|nr:hypothetical protein DFJ77DRAFT_509599 [Powellomyces hirtus]